MHRSIFCPHILGVSVGRAPLKLLCDNMKYQILSRAFYGCEYLSLPCCCLGMCDRIRDGGMVLGELGPACCTCSGWGANSWALTLSPEPREQQHWGYKVRDLSW